MKQVSRFLLVFAIAIVTFVSRVGHAEDAPAFSVPPEVAKEISQASFDQLMGQLTSCKADNKTCKKTLDAVAPLLEECKHGCTPELALENGCKDLEFSKHPKSPAAKVLVSGGPVRMIACQPPSVAKNGVCWCNPRGDEVVTAKTFGKGEGACVPSIQVFDRFVEQTKTTFNYICESADGVNIPQEELAKEGITERLSADDPRCKKTGLYVYYLLQLNRRFASKQLTPENWSILWLDYLKRKGGQNTIQTGDDDIAQMQTDIKQLKDDVALLKQKGVHVQLLGTGFYNWRPESGAQDTYGLMLRPNIIYMFSANNGILFGGGLGYGKQPWSQSVMWRASIEWYHNLNQTSETSKGLWSWRLGGYAEGGSLRQNVQDEMQIGATTGAQYSYGHFVLDFGLSGGVGPNGLYVGGQRVGVSKNHFVLQPALGVGFTFN